VTWLYLGARLKHRPDRTELAARLIDEATLWRHDPAVGTRDLVDTAVAMLVAGEDSVLIGELAGLPADATSWEVERLLDRVLSNVLGTRLPTSEIDRLNRMLRALCRRYFDGELTARQLTQWSHANGGHYSPVTEVLAAIDDDFDLAEAGYTGWTDVESEVRTEAESLLARTEYTATLDDVVWLIDEWSRAGIVVHLDGGWGVDALLGKHTRAHGDLDVAVAVDQHDAFRALLDGAGFIDHPREDSRPENYVLARGPLLVDVHVYGFDGDEEVASVGIAYPRASLTGQGTLGTRGVGCVSPEWVIRFHSGYELDRRDVGDLYAVAQRFGLELLPEQVPVVGRYYKLFPPVIPDHPRRRGLRDVLRRKRPPRVRD
jgi:lincosamide nucleotidyltransferase A/C/D/E